MRAYPKVLHRLENVVFLIDGIDSDLVIIKGIQLCHLFEENVSGSDEVYDVG